MSRTKILFEIQQDKGEATPSRKQVKDIVAAKTGADRELLVIGLINPSWGANLSSGIAYLYKDQKAFDRLSFKHLKKRDAKEPKSKKAEEAPKEETPAEEAK